jgi:hypothetical protein
MVGKEISDPITYCILNPMVALRTINDAAEETVVQPRKAQHLYEEFSMEQQAGNTSHQGLPVYHKFAKF